MILAAALLLLVALGLFVAGVATAVIALYWGCVAAAAVAALLLAVAWRGLRRPAAPETGAPATAAAPGLVPPGAPSEPLAAATAAAVEPSTGEQGSAAATLPPRHDVDRAGGVAAAPDDDPPVEEVEVTDLLLVVDLRAEVLVVDEHPRYHLAGCAFLAGRSTIPLPLDEARADGFTPCGRCAPDRHLADAERGRRARTGPDGDPEGATEAD